MSYKDYIHPILDAIISKATVTGKEYHSVINIPYLELKEVAGKQLSKNITSHGLEVIIEVRIKPEEEGDDNGDPKSSNKDKTRH